MKEYINPNDIISLLANLPQLSFEVTDACNLRCKYCAYGELYSDYDTRNNEMMPIEKARNLLDFLAGLWNSEMNLSFNKDLFISFYGGEPLLNIPFIKNIVGYVRDTLKHINRKIRFSMTTNSVLLDKYADFLVKHDFDLLISLDGNKDNMVYRLYKDGRASFDKVIRNIDKLCADYPEYFYNRVQFNAVLHDKNSVEDIYSFIKGRYNKVPNIGELNPSGLRKDKLQEFTNTYRNSQGSLLQSQDHKSIENDMFLKADSYKSLLHYLHQYSGFVFKDYLDLLFDRSRLPKRPTGTCLPFEKKMFVTVNGKILPCERVGHQYALGEVTDTEVKLDFDEIAHKYNTYLSKVDSLCSDCMNKKACTQCVFYFEDLDRHVKCDGFMDDEAFKEYADSQMKFLEKHPEAYVKIMEEAIVR